MPKFLLTIFKNKVQNTFCFSTSKSFLSPKAVVAVKAVGSKSRLVQRRRQYNVIKNLRSLLTRGDHIIKKNILNIC